MIEMLDLPFMRQAALACVLLAFVLAPLGREVIARRIVFVDLALAQLSALGAVIGSTVEWDPIASSVLVTLAGAALLVLPAETDLPQEALMGLVYAVASAAAVLILAKSPHGDADLLHILFGNILAVTPRQLWLLAGLAAAVAAFSRYRRTRAASGRGATLVFYLLLAVSIALAMKSAGVLVVFTYLVAPGLAIQLLGLSRAGGVVSVVSAAACGVAGLVASYAWDLPSGSAIVAAFGVWLVLAAAAARMFRMPARMAKGDLTERRDAV
jgi:zinc/manganese transport system permease protein